MGRYLNDRQDSKEKKYQHDYRFSCDSFSQIPLNLTTFAWVLNEK